MECWWVQPSSRDGSVHTHLRARSVCGTQLMAACWDFTETKALLGIWGNADVQNQLDGIVKNKAIYQKVCSYCHGRAWLQLHVALRKVANSTTP